MFNGSSQQFLDKLLSYDLTNWQNYEDFTDYFEVFKQNILSKFNKTLSIGEYFIGGYISKNIAKLKLNLNETDRILSKHQFPAYPNFTNLIYQLEEEEYQWDDIKYLFKNASSKSWGDSWKNFNKIVILYQKKTEEYTTERQSLSYTEIDTEIKKYNELNSKIINLNIDEFKEKKFITCILTTKPISNECIKDITENSKNLIVISRDSFLQYYGEAFTFKLKYCNYFN
jgi:hypothetical protein